VKKIACIAVVCLFAQLLAGETAPGASGAGVPVVVELFTSEGCSSCPPADALLMELDRRQPVAGAEIIALGEHVDYWNQLDWKDRFSSALYSQRQSRYAARFHLESVYTPQMVINGRAEFVGNDAARAAKAIAAAAHAPAIAARIGIRTAADAVQVEISHAPLRALDVFLAVTESGLSTQVGKGENRGRLLRHTAVVRELRKLGTTSGGHFAAQTPVTLDPGWRRQNLRAVVFLQDASTLEIAGAAQASWR
jgi:hypothetical protein